MRRIVTVFVLSSFLHAQFMGGSGQSSAQLPTKWIASTISSANESGLFSSPVSKTVKSSGGDYTTLQAAITAIGSDAVNCDEIITVDTALQGLTTTLGSGGSVTIGYTCPVGHYVWIRPSALLSLPAQGTNVGISDAANMFKIVKTAGDDLPVVFQDGKDSKQARGFIVTGMELDCQPLLIHYCLAVGNADNSTATYADHVLIDRSYIHYSGGSSGEIANLVSFQGTWWSITDSYLDGTHTKSASIAESHGVWANNGTGPGKIVNNTVAGSPTENVFFGGQDVWHNGDQVRDVEIRRNTLSKDWSQQAQGYCAKNLLEFKNINRVLANGNTMQYSWHVSCGGGGQNGAAIVITPVNQNGSCTWCAAANIIFSDNVVENWGGYYINLTGRGVTGNGTYPATQFVDVLNNIFRGGNATTFSTNLGGGAGGGFGYSAGGTVGNGPSAIGDAPFNVRFRHNGIYSSATNGGYWMTVPTGGNCGIYLKRWNLDFKYNIVINDGEMINCWNRLEDVTNQAVPPFANTSIMANVMVGITAWVGTTTTVQSGNFFPAGSAASPPTGLFTSYATGVGTAPALPGALSNLVLAGTDTACGGVSCKANPNCESADCGPNIAQILAAQAEANDSTKWGPRSLQ